MTASGVPYNHMVTHTAHALPFATYQNSHSNGQDFFDPLATSVPSTYPVSWPHNLASNNMSSSAPRPLVRFGSDSHFGPSGYIPPLDSTEMTDQNAMQRFEWLEGDAQSSAPPTQPSTEPSSPVYTRKRKVEVDQSAKPNHSNGFIENAEPAEQEDVEVETATTSPRKKRRVTLKSEPTTPFRPSQSQSSPATSNIKATTRGKRKSLPAVPSISSARPSSATTKPRPSSATSHTSTNTNKPKRPPAISSLSGSGSAGGVRVPLTSDQKRANHTNSEQRRRDQAQKAFARLFDLVPELEQEGKLSQMKKLERVVRKIRELEEGNRECRRRIEAVEKGGG